MPIFNQETDAEYHGVHGWTHYGSSLAKAALISPALVAYRRANPQKRTKAMRLGSVWDAMLSYGIDFAEADHIVLLPEGTSGRTKDGKAIIARADAAHKPWASHEERQLLHTVYASMPGYIHEELGALSTKRQTQLSARSVIDGVPMQMRADAMDHDGMMDFKLTGIPLEAWPSHAIKMGYHIQSGWYRHIAKTLTGKTHGFCFLVSETKPPFRTARFNPNQAWLEFGDDKAATAHSILGRCIASGAWGDTSETEIDMHLPGWASTATVVEGDDGSLDLEDA